MYGELTDKETVSRLEYSLENQQQDQFEVLLYKKNSKYQQILIASINAPKVSYCCVKIVNIDQLNLHINQQNRYNWLVAVIQNLFELYINSKTITVKALLKPQQRELKLLKRVSTNWSLTTNFNIPPVLMQYQYLSLKLTQ